MVSIKRVLAVTAGLILTGVVVGAACGGIAIALVVVLGGDWRSVLRPGLWTLGGVVGAVIGAIVAPAMTGASATFPPCASSSPAPPA